MTAIVADAVAALCYGIALAGIFSGFVLIVALTIREVIER